ncbi:L-lactate permease [Pseudalkalibacillus hwajinpoensis]|uniref:L-lactate permease n=1 Tax=Guptibacillus hwajinpoensis TaxID=208199 RepID=UPI00325AD6DB
MSGSATFSNMMFSLFQFSVADQLQMNEQLVLALQVLGANAGNMICVLNVLASCICSRYGWKGRNNHSNDDWTDDFLRGSFRSSWIRCYSPSLIIEKQPFMR